MKVRMYEILGNQPDKVLKKSVHRSVNLRTGQLAKGSMCIDILSKLDLNWDFENQLCFFLVCSSEGIHIRRNTNDICDDTQYSRRRRRELTGAG